MINFCFGENVVYTFFEANAWRGVTADNFSAVLIFLKKTYKEQFVMLSFVAYFETLLQLSLRLCQFTCTLWNLGKKITSYHFSKKCLFSVFLHIEAQLSLKNAWLPPVFFLDFNSPWYDLLVSHSHYLGKKYFPLVGTLLRKNYGTISRLQFLFAENSVPNTV